MKYTVRLTRIAERDLVRLVRFLAEKNPDAARKASSLLQARIRSLASMPARARRLPSGLHVMDVPFGDSGYAIWFDIRDDHVIVARVFHMREDRQAG